MSEDRSRPYSRSALESSPFAAPYLFFEHLRKSVPAAHAKLGVNIRYMGFHRVDGNVLLLGDLLVRCTLIVSPTLV